jgi:N-acyl-D-amino-acid deacylase
MKKTLLIWALLSLHLLSFGQSYDLVITNSRVIDGSGNPWYRADVGILDGKIAKIGKIAPSQAKAIFDAQNQFVAPGFIDVHTHIEGGIERLPNAENFLFDGVTSIITGNCGSGYTGLKYFFDDLQKLGVSVNIGSLIGHNAVRSKVMKNVFRDPTAKEQAEMEAVVEKAMKEGAMGLATGLIYIPGTYAKTSEVVGLAKVAAKFGGIYASHIRNEEDKVKEAIAEAINIGREANIPVEISHFKISGKPLWGQSSLTIGMVEAARAEGLDVTVDQYPYTASSTNLGTRLPSWALADGDSAINARLADPATRQKIRDEMIKSVKEDKRNSYDYAVVARYKADSTFNGKSITEINTMLGRKNNLKTEADLIMDMVAKGGAQMIYHRMFEADVEQILKYPNTMIASDAGVIKLGENVPHPRGYGSNARVLGRYVRERKTLTWEDAVRRMTSLPAQRFGLTNRGLLKEGYAADLVVFDQATVGDAATYALPHAYSKGFALVMVNGIGVIENGKHNGKRPGQILLGKGVEL